MGRLYSLPIFALFVFVLFPLTVLGNVDYARVVDHTDSAVIIKRNTLTEERWYQCSVGTLTCTQTGANTRITNPSGTPAYMFAYRALMPAGASNLRQSPDGRFIAFYIPATSSRNTRTFGVMDTTDLSIYTKTEKIAYWDLLTEGIRYYVFSPDSKSLIYISDVHDEQTLFSVDLAALPKGGGALPSTRLFSREYQVADVLWKDNHTIYYVANRDNPYAWSLYELNLDTYSLTRIAENVSYADNLTHVGTYLLFTKNDENGLRPALYDSNTQQVHHFSLPEQDVTTSKGQAVSLKEGLTGVFLLEPSKNSDTLLVWLHGGPYRQTSLGYHPFFSYGGYDWVLETARRADVGVLKLDYPGSAGFGRLFAESLTGEVGVKDAKESTAAIADFAARNRYTNVYLMGNSYGGYLAMRLLVDTPSQYKGVLSVNGVADWMTLLSRLSNSIFNVHFRGSPDESNYALYGKASIYDRIGSLTNQKVVLIHGESDRTIPFSQSQGLALMLGVTGKNVELIPFADEDHVFKKEESFETLCRETLTLVQRESHASLCALGTP